MAQEQARASHTKQEKPCRPTPHPAQQAHISSTAVVVALGHWEEGTQYTVGPKADLLHSSQDQKQKSNSRAKQNASAIPQRFFGAPVYACSWCTAGVFLAIARRVTRNLQATLISSRQQRSNDDVMYGLRKTSLEAGTTKTRRKKNAKVTSRRAREHKRNFNPPLPVQKKRGGAGALLSLRSQLCASKAHKLDDSWASSAASGVYPWRA